jgi:hypothetical protein
MSMEYKEALEKFSQSYIDRYDVEFPLIFSLADFKDKRVLEIGPAEGYFVGEVSKFTDRIESVDSYEKLQFSDGSFDITLSRWIIQGVEDIDNFVKEMCRVANQNVIIILPSDEGDETEILRIKFPEKSNTRAERLERIKKLISECGFQAKEEKKLMRFLFKDLDETIDIFCALAFRNEITQEEKTKLRDFLAKRKDNEGIHITQGASFIVGTK